MDKLTISHSASRCEYKIQLVKSCVPEKFGWIYIFPHILPLITLFTVTHSGWLFKQGRCQLASASRRADSAPTGTAEANAGKSLIKFAAICGMAACALYCTSVCLCFMGSRAVLHHVSTTPCRVRFLTDHIMEKKRCPLRLGERSPTKAGRTEV